MPSILVFIIRNVTTPLSCEPLRPRRVNRYDPVVWPVTTPSCERTHRPRRVNGPTDPTVWTVTLSGRYTERPLHWAAVTLSLSGRYTERPLQPRCVIINRHTVFFSSRARWFHHKRESMAHGTESAPATPYTPHMTKALWACSRSRGRHETCLASRVEVG